ncbi:MAG: hypothetical protein CMJ29_07705 [Phycisphaerae bacterium]|nr:hypothetical protein [Phycisphaerae bacterium]|tara:strand:- start:537 stop:1679 length:1143 start_codon:yes stop_codon:yes gene_type:complete
MRMLIDRFKDGAGCVGVEFTERLVRLLQVRSWKDQLDVTGVSIQPMSRTSEPGSDQDVLSARLRSAVVAGGFVGRRCAVCLPRNDVQLYVTRLPEMPEDELREAIRWEAADRLGIDHKSVEADCIRTGAVAEGGRNEILIVATPTEVIGRRLEAVMAAGLRPMAVDTHFGAVARVFSRHHRREADQSSIRAVIEVGDTSSTLIVLHGERIALCRSLDIGGCHMDARVAEHLGLELDAAADLRRVRLQAGISSEVSGIDPSTDRAVHESLRPLLEELAREVLMCLRYYGVTFKGQRPGRLMLTGAEACEPGLASAIAQRCSMSVEMDDERATLQRLETSLLGTRMNNCGPASAWAVSAGLSLRSLAATRRRRAATSLERAA